jgi:hypothetical protein
VFNVAIARAVANSTKRALRKGHEGAGSVALSS